jgi:osomolarity two-component system response regulator SSK1
MPVMDGIQATKEIRRAEKENALAGYPPLMTQSNSGQMHAETSSQEARSLPSPYRSSVIIVALTASSLQSDRVAALAAGCNDFLTKPVSLLWLNNKIIEWGSIKALQMWADVRSDVVKSISSDQAAQARNVAERLHFPQGRSTPSPSRASAGSGTAPQTNASPPTTTPGNVAPTASTTSPVLWSPTQPPATFRSQSQMTAINNSGTQVSSDASETSPRGQYPTTFTELANEAHMGLFL